jgi:hypothetical protein
MSSNKDDDDTVNKTTLDSFELIIRNLKILGSIKSNDKLVKHGDTIKIDSPYIYQGLSRYWYGDSRKQSLDHIEKLINQSFNKIDVIYGSEIESRTGGLNNNYYKNMKGQNYFETENAQKLTIFSNELNNVIKGLNSLKQTYQMDISICSRIDVVIEKINLRIQKIQELFQINIGNSVGIAEQTIDLEDIPDQFQFSDDEEDTE